jgi:DNA-binding MarR family transcriptional regulator
MSERAEEFDRLSLVIERLVRSLRSHRGSHGLSPAAAAALGNLVDVGTMGVSELARMSSVTQPAMSQLIPRLVADGLVERTTDDRDRRSVMLTATPRGREVYLERRAERAARIEQAVSRLPVTDRSTLAAAVPVLERLTDVSDADIPDTGSDKK